MAERARRESCCKWPSDILGKKKSLPLEVQASEVLRWRDDGTTEFVLIGGVHTVVWDQWLFGYTTKDSLGVTPRKKPAEVRSGTCHG